METTQAAGIPMPIDVMPESKGRQWLLTRDFSLIWWSQLISQVGDGVTRLALLWFVYSITGSPLKTTVIGLLQTLPPILFGPLFGVCVDRLPKKWIMIGSDVLRALLIGVIPCLIAVDQFTIERLYVLVFLTAIASAVFGPAMTAAVPFLVTRAQFTAANALLQTTTSLGVILGPALSGIGIAALSSQEVLCINALTYLGSAVCLLPIRLKSTPAPQSSGGLRTAFLRDLLEGVRFALIKQHRILLLILAASLYTFGGAAFSTLYPVFAKKLLDLGPVEVGYLWSAFGVGLLMMSLALVGVSSWDLRNRFLLIAASSAVNGAALVGLLWVHGEMAAAMGLMVCIGAGTGTLTPIAWGVLQEITPGHMIGRVLSIYTTAAMTTAIAGMSIFGWVTQTFEERTGLFGIALAMFGTSALSIALTRWVRVRQPRGAGSEAASHLRRRMTDQ
jgi:DHA3 family macrolide efflux protein-like MFS transporter